MGISIKHKGEVLELFMKWKRNMEKSTGRKIKVLCSDNEESIQLILSGRNVAIRA